MIPSVGGGRGNKILKWKPIFLITDLDSPETFTPIWPNILFTDGAVSDITQNG